MHVREMRDQGVKILQYQPRLGLDGMPAGTANTIELSVPTDASSLGDAIQLGRQRCGEGDSMRHLSASLATGDKGSTRIKQKEAQNAKGSGNQPKTEARCVWLRSLLAFRRGCFRFA